MNTPLVSVVIPAFRSGNLILESIESVMLQTFQDFELLIVDNNASRDTRETIQHSLKKFPTKIKVFHESTQGNSSARNRGIREAKGDYIALLDDDDKMYPQRLEKQVKEIRNNPEASIVHGRLDYVAFDGQTLIGKNKSNDIQDWARVLFFDHPRFPTDPPRSVAPSVSLFSKKRVLEAGGFDERFNPCFVEDTEFSLRMWTRGPLLEIPEPLVAFRLPSREFLNQKRKNVTNWFLGRKNLNVFFSILAQKYYNPDSPESRRRFQKIRSQWLRETAMDLLKLQNGREIGQKFLKQAIQDVPFDLKNWKWLVRSYLPEDKLRNSLGMDDPTTQKVEDFVSPQLLDTFFTLPKK